MVVRLIEMIELLCCCRGTVCCSGEMGTGYPANQACRLQLYVYSGTTHYCVFVGRVRAIRNWAGLRLMLYLEPSCAVTGVMQPAIAPLRPTIIRVLGLDIAFIPYRQIPLNPSPLDILCKHV